MAWATGFGPLPGGLPFLLPVELERYNAFWKVNPSPPGIITYDRGWKWPDLMGHGGGSPSFFASERVLSFFRLNDALIGRITEMPVNEINAKRLKSIPPPKYYVIECVPGIDVDFAASEIDTDASGKPIFPYNGWRWPLPLIKARASSWNGTDLFSYRNWSGPLKWVCTEKLKDLAEKENFLNMSFQPRELIQ